MKNMPKQLLTFEEPLLKFIVLFTVMKDLKRICSLSMLDKSVTYIVENDIS